ncbi:MAG: hypothetical protein JSS10_05555 [Verrucomicrobia bacterium]|nr:hypothetical protein [Verrucomicrobiota bacterium]
MTNYFIEPFKHLLWPVGKDFAAPFYNMGKDFCVPVYILMTGQEKSKPINKKEAQENWEKLLKVIIRIGVAYAFFQAYQKTWKAGIEWGGKIGGAGVFCLTYLVGNVIDPKSNYTGVSGWFLYKGVIDMLKSFGSSHAAMLCLLLVRDRKFKEETGFLNFNFFNHPIKGAASQLAEWTFKEPEVAKPEPKPPHQ